MTVCVFISRGREDHRRVSQRRGSQWRRARGGVDWAPDVRGPQSTVRTVLLRASTATGFHYNCNSDRTMEAPEDVPKGGRLCDLIGVPWFSTLSTG
jgi:hypothetical protein